MDMLNSSNLSYYGTPLLNFIFRIFAKLKIKKISAENSTNNTSSCANQGLKLSIKIKLNYHLKK